MNPSELPFADLEARAEDAAILLAHLANKHRLLILCRLALDGEASVGALCEATGLSQSALSQHLARLREEELLAVRREGLFAYYRVADPRVLALLKALKEILCP